MKARTFPLFLGLFLFFASAPLVSAFYYGAQSGIVVKEEVESNAYLAGKSIYIEEEIQGDAFLAGESIVVNSSITEDGMMIGARVQINGSIGDDLRLIGEKIELNGTIGGEMIALGSQFHLGKQAVVRGDLVFAAEDLRLQGVIEGHVLGLSSRIYLDALVEGHVKLHHVEEIMVGEQAEIRGNLSYSSLNRLPELEAIVAGEVNYKPVTHQLFSSQALVRLGSFFLLFHFLSALLIGLIFIAGFQYFGSQLVRIATLRPLKALFLGFLLIFALPLAFGFLIGTVAGIPLALILLLIWMALLYLSRIFVCIMIAAKGFTWEGKESFLQKFASFSLILFVYDLLTLIPLLGIVTKNGALLSLGLLINGAKFLLVLLSLGALMLYKRELIRALREKKLL